MLLCKAIELTQTELLTKEHYYFQNINIVCCLVCFLSNSKDESDNRQNNK